MRLLLEVCHDARELTADDIVGRAARASFFGLWGMYREHEEVSRHFIEDRRLPWTAKGTEPTYAALANPLTLSGIAEDYERGYVPDERAIDGQDEPVDAAVAVSSVLDERESTFFAPSPVVLRPSAGIPESPAGGAGLSPRCEESSEIRREIIHNNQRRENWSVLFANVAEEELVRRSRISIDETQRRNHLRQDCLRRYCHALDTCIVRLTDVEAATRAGIELDEARAVATLSRQRRFANAQREINHIEREHRHGLERLYRDGLDRIIRCYTPVKFFLLPKTAERLIAEAQKEFATLADLEERRRVRLAEALRRGQEPLRALDRARIEAAESTARAELERREIAVCAAIGKEFHRGLLLQSKLTEQLARRLQCCIADQGKVRLDLQHQENVQFNSLRCDRIVLAEELARFLNVERFECVERGHIAAAHGTAVAKLRQRMSVAEYAEEVMRNARRAVHGTVVRHHQQGSAFPERCELASEGDAIRGPPNANDSMAEDVAIIDQEEAPSSRDLHTLSDDDEQAMLTNRRRQAGTPEVRVPAIVNRRSWLLTEHSTQPSVGLNDTLVSLLGVVLVRGLEVANVLSPSSIFLKGDLLLDCNGASLRGRNHLVDLLSRLSSGRRHRECTFTVMRRGETVVLRFPM